ncbi:MAG: hypothetical protein AAFV07_15720, partial [Bacteroidota bacterium]
MDYRFWLELQTGPKAYHKVARMWGLPSAPQAKEFLTIPVEAARIALPECLALQELLGTYEAMRPSLDEAGVHDGAAAVWVRLSSEGPLRLDPVLLGQLGTEYIKLCLTDEADVWSFRQ